MKWTVKIKIEPGSDSLILNDAKSAASLKTSRIWVKAKKTKERILFVCPECPAWEQVDHAQIGDMDSLCVVSQEASLASPPPLYKHIDHKFNQENPEV